MGLDMFLSAKKYTSKYTDEKLNKKIWKMFPEVEQDDISSATIGLSVGYWRKANAIHKWFVDNVQDGRDECQTTYVSKENLEKLKEICEKVLEFKNGKTKKQKIKTGHANGKDTFEEIDVLADTKEIEELLPTTSGFFFGATNYDEYYFNDLELTIEIIDKCLKLSENWDFEYHSSW